MCKLSFLLALKGYLCSLAAFCVDVLDYKLFPFISDSLYFC
jgi:hypothetical protein